MALTNYTELDGYKRKALRAAKKTFKGTYQLGYNVVRETVGESVTLIEFPDMYVAHLIEALGTKNWDADNWAESSVTWYDWIAQDTVLAVTHDMLASGALPVSVTMLLAVGHASWFANRRRTDDFLRGWQETCQKVGCAWIGGETPELQAILDPHNSIIAGSGMGIIANKSHIALGSKIQEGDAMIGLAASGIHANGLTPLRSIVWGLPQKHRTVLSDDHTVAEAILTPAPIYVPVVRDCQLAGIDIHYMSHITGHGWRKIMRANRDFRYVVEALAPPLPIYEFLQAKSGMTLRELYATFNMGLGYVLWVADAVSDQLIATAARHDITAWKLGITQKGPRSVSIRPLGITYRSSELQLR